MKSVFLSVAAALLLAACQQGGDYVGKGPLVLSSKAVQTIHEYRHGSSGTHSNLVLAVDRYSRYLGGVYCPSTDIHSCIGEGSLTASMAVDNCSKDGKYDCAVYSVHDDIVWQGPVYLRHAAHRQNMPFNGVWPMEVSWEDGRKETLQLVGMEGQLTVTGLGGGTCTASIRPTSSGGGDFGLDCQGDLQAGGSYSGSGDAIAGKGRATDGRKFSLTLHLKSRT